MKSNIGWIIFFITISFVSTQFFNEEEEAENEGSPIHVPGKCPENQLVYKVNDEDVCDCDPEYIYYGPQDKCYLAYRQGPCKPKEYLGILKPSLAVMCLKNPCSQDEMVPYKNRCYKLGTSRACPKRKGENGLLRVNSTTLEIQCIYGVTELNIISVNSCPPGSKRIATGQCRKPANYT